jgi:hypothetical protein
LLRLENGKRAGDDWLKDLAPNAGATVRPVATPKPFKDVNEWTQAAAKVDELKSALVRAET